MKILIVTDAWEPQVNGVVTTLQNTKKVLEQSGHMVCVVEPTMFYGIPCPGYREIQLSWVTQKRVNEILEDLNPDKIHIATEGPIGLAFRKALKKRNEAWSSSFHTKFAEYVEARIGFGCKAAWTWLRWVYRNDSFILVTTESMRQELIENGFEAEKLIVWGRGVDNKVFNTGNHVEYESDTILLNVGRVSIEKNLEAFYELKTPGRKIQVGDGPMLENYRARYPEVEFVGAKFGHELAEYYQKADVFVFPSKSDTFGLVMIEAMRCGAAVAAYPVTGPIDIVENGKNGYLDENLENAVDNAMRLDYMWVEVNSRQYTWEAATLQFEKALVPRTK